MKTKHQPKQYTVGESSRLLLDALDAFQAFKNTLLDALTSIYDDEQGDRMFNEHYDQFEAVERTVTDYLRQQFIKEMGTDREAVTI